MWYLWKFTKAAGRGFWLDDQIKGVFFVNFTMGRSKFIIKMTKK